ncbi:MAG: toll/interleukin-1 receptor domain-containing protein [Candidatus Omnitrophota bacterium]
MTDKKWNVFISYASEDKERYIDPIIEELKRKNITYWLDQNEIIDESFAKKINEGLANSEYVVAFLSQRYFQKKWTEEEFWAAKELERPENVVIPILLEPKDTLPSLPLLGRYIKWEGAPKVADEIAKRISFNQAKHVPDRTSKPKIEITSNLLEWCLERIFQDQYDEGNARGAWSRMYPGYLNVLFQEDPSNGKETITFSTWIADALMTYWARCENKEIKDEIWKKIHRFRDYLIRHYEDQISGFGLSGPTDSVGQSTIIFDLRHTAWAVMALTRIDIEDNETSRIIRNASGKLWEQISTMNPAEQFPVTNAALHRFLSEKSLPYRLDISPHKIRNEMKRIEAELINKFNSRHYCWGWLNDDKVTKTCIDNALTIIHILDYYSIIDVELRDQLEKAATHLLDNVLIHLDGNKAGLPFMKGSRVAAPDLGTTVFFVYILIDKLRLDRNNDKIRKLINFINSLEARLKYANYSYPWYLAPIFHLESETR